VAVAGTAMEDDGIFKSISKARFGHPERSEGPQLRDEILRFAQNDILSQGHICNAF
jgi:hypothetical protein